MTKTNTKQTNRPDWNAAPRTTWKRTRIEWRNGQPVVWHSTAYSKGASKCTAHLRGVAA